MVPFPVFGVLPAGSIRVCQDQAIQFTWIKAIPCNAGGPVLNLGGCQHFAQLVNLRPAIFDLQWVLRPLVHFLQAQRPGPLAEVHGHHGAKRGGQQGKQREDSRRVVVQTPSPVSTSEQVKPMNFKIRLGTSLTVQWLKTALPMQGARGNAWSGN